uniref:50S ribosomal protein L18 n=1 Tax=Arundo donax TaxID=35708 RepID=A0A0A9GFU6_ARUDO
MSLRQLLLQARRRCAYQPPRHLPGLIFLCRALSILPSEASAVPRRRAPPLQVQLPQSLPCSSSEPLGSGFRIDVVDSDLWPVSLGLSLDPSRGSDCPDGLEQPDDDELHDSDDEIDDMRHRKRLFYKLDRGSREYEENNVPLHRKRKRDKANDKNSKECKNVETVKSVSSNVPKLKAKRAVRGDDMVEVKRERVPTFNQMTDPYHHPFCLDIHVTKGSVRACFVHRVTSRVVVVAHSISKDMKFDLGSRKGKGMKACAAVGALLAKRAIEDDIHNAVYTPRKGDRIEGKIEVVLRAIIENGVDVKVKLKQRKPIKNTLLQHDQS